MSDKEIYKIWLDNIQSKTAGEIAKMLGIEYHLFTRIISREFKNKSNRTNKLSMENSKGFEEVDFGIVAQLSTEIQKKEDYIFMLAIRDNSNPPIKGIITKGKLKWRGIKLIEINHGHKVVKWLEQKGKQISPKIEIYTNKLT